MADIAKLWEDLEAEGYSDLDIQEICSLETGYGDRCREIAYECMQEGLPPHGEEYARRCEKERDWYRNMIAEIRVRYEEELYYEEEERRRKARGVYC